MPRRGWRLRHTLSPPLGCGHPPVAREGPVRSARWRLSYSGGAMHSDPRVAQQYTHRITLCRVRDGYECRIDDANGRAVAILVGHLDFDPADPDPIEFTVERWRVVLPVRP